MRPNSEKHYHPKVAEARAAITGTEPIRIIAAKAKIADSQLVRLLNGVARRPSFQVVRAVAKARNIENPNELFDKLEALWNLMGKLSKPRKKRATRTKRAA